MSMDAFVGGIVNGDGDSHNGATTGSSSSGYGSSSSSCSSRDSCTSDNAVVVCTNDNKDGGGVTMLSLISQHTTTGTKKRQHQLDTGSGAGSGGCSSSSSRKRVKRSTTSSQSTMNHASVGVASNKNNNHLDGGQKSFLNHDKRIEAPRVVPSYSPYTSNNSMLFAAVEIKGTKNRKCLLKPPPTNNISTTTGTTGVVPVPVVTSAKRREQNRKAASMSRERKKLLLDDLEDSITFYTSTNHQLKNQNDELTRLVQEAQEHIKGNIMDDSEKSSTTHSKHKKVRKGTKSSTKLATTTTAAAATATATAPSEQQQQQKYHTKKNHRNMDLPPVGASMDAMINFQMATSERIKMVRSGTSRICSLLKQPGNESYKHFPKQEESSVKKSANNMIPFQPPTTTTTTPPTSATNSENVGDHSEHQHQQPKEAPGTQNSTRFATTTKTASAFASSSSTTTTAMSLEFGSASTTTPLEQKQYNKNIDLPPVGASMDAMIKFQMATSAQIKMVQTGTSRICSLLKQPGKGSFKCFPNQEENVKKNTNNIPFQPTPTTTPPPSATNCENFGAHSEQQHQPKEAPGTHHSTRFATSKTASAFASSTTTEFGSESTTPPEQKQYNNNIDLPPVGASIDAMINFQMATTERIKMVQPGTSRICTLFKQPGKGNTDYFPNQENVKKSCADIPFHPKATPTAAVAAAATNTDHPIDRHLTNTTNNEESSISSNLSKQNSWNSIQKQQQQQQDLLIALQIQKEKYTKQLSENAVFGTASTQIPGTTATEYKIQKQQQENAQLLLLEHVQQQQQQLQLLNQLMTPTPVYSSTSTGRANGPIVLPSVFDAAIPNAGSSTTNLFDQLSSYSLYQRQQQQEQQKEQREQRSHFLQQEYERIQQNKNELLSSVVQKRQLPKRMIPRLCTNSTSWLSASAHAPPPPLPPSSSNESTVTDQQIFEQQERVLVQRLRLQLFNESNAVTYPNVRNTLTTTNIWEQQQNQHLQQQSLSWSPNVATNTVLSSLSLEQLQSLRIQQLLDEHRNRTNTNERNRTGTE